MILDSKPLTLSELKDYVPNLDEKPVMKDYLKKFSILPKEKALELYKEIESLNNPKIRPHNLVKIVDLMPKNSEDLNKIFSDVSLTEDETNAILAIIKKY